MSKSYKRSEIRRSVRLGVEALEDRRLLAGNITATFFGGNLVIRGDALDNSLTVSQTAPTTVSVLGKTNAGTATTVNGLAGPVVFNGVLNSIDIDTKGGNDQILIGNNSADLNSLNNEILFGAGSSFSGLASARTVVKNSIVVRGGDGIDAVGIIADVGGDIYADLGANNDGIGVQNSVVRGSVIFEGGTGDQPSLLVRNSQVSNQIIINGGTGSNRMIVSGSSAAGVSLNGKDGSDTVEVSSSNITNNLAINELGGSDSTVVTGSRIGGSLSLDAGSGDDSVTIDNTSIRFDAIVILGLGNDSVQLRSSSNRSGSPLVMQTTIGGVLVLDGGLGNDTITVGSSAAGEQAVMVTGYTTIIGGDGLDTVTIRKSQFSNGVTIDAGAGNDVVDIGGTTIARNLSVFLGLGDDSLTIAATSAAFADLYGGLGRDGSKLTGNTFGRLTLREFEFTLP